MEFQDTRVKRKQFTFYGTIQGVGFRPAVFRFASALGLTGFVQNRRSTVVAEVQGPSADVSLFERDIRARLPATARVESIESAAIEPIGDEAFTIKESLTGDYVFPPIPPDLAICGECRRELLDSQDRRYLYPFITCTQCGPRYSIVEDTPFDRENTSMADFIQCPACFQEYSDPADRRFHSQTNSCAECGPELYLGSQSGRVSGNPLLEAIKAIGRGKIVAVQGIGGFHLAADPSFAGAMQKLRSDKGRERKPFALMVRDLAEARRICYLEEGQEELLGSAECPILILRAREGAGPGTPGMESGPEDYLLRVSDTGTLGIMLPYTPLHLLLFFHPGLEIPYRHLVMTSGNLKDEPIITEPDKALSGLSDIADLFLCHNRRILFRTDDSVVRPASDFVSHLSSNTQPIKTPSVDTPLIGPSPESGSRGSRITIIRRSRGYVPSLIRLAVRGEGAKCILAVGGDLKSAPAFARGGDIYLAPYIGDLENPVTAEAFQSQIERILALYGIEPERIVSDMHPLYYSSAWAESSEFAGVDRVKVQHHHAHILSVMAEHGLEEVLGLAFDGTGYGSDGAIWGGEFLLAGRRDFKRLGCFREFRLPGGDAAVLRPIRIAYAMLYKRLSSGRAESILSLALSERRLLKDILERGINSPATSSLGRIFDAAAALLDLVDTVNYEGEGPIKLEALAQKELERYGSQGSSGRLDRSDGSDRLSGWDGRPGLSRAQGTGQQYNPGESGKIAAVYDFIDQDLTLLAPLSAGTADGEFFRIDCGPLIEHIALNRNSGRAGSLALLFHRVISAASLQGALRMREMTGIERIALSGGVFQNMLLRSLLVPALAEQGFSVYTNNLVPPGDGGLSVGQTYYTG